MFWWEIPEVMRSMNRLISGDAKVDWPTYTVRKYFADRLPLARCLSLGAGAGQLERDLARLNLFEQCDAYDISPAAVKKAEKAAREEGWTNIRYAEADINALHLPPGSFDSVWVYGAMHHFTRLEHLSREIRRALRPGGLLILNEYVGPKRFQFPARQKEIANLCLRLLPERYRRVSAEAVQAESAKQQALAASQVRTPKGLARLFAQFRRVPIAPELTTPAQASADALRITVGFPTAQDVMTDDPSEAVRSDEILPVLSSDFDFVEKIEWGGNIAQFVLAGIAGNFSDEDADSVRLIRLIFDIEQALIQCGELSSDFAYLVARPKP